MLYNALTGLSWGVGCILGPNWRCILCEQRDMALGMFNPLFGELLC